MTSIDRKRGIDGETDLLANFLFIEDSLERGGYHAEAPVASIGSHSGVWQCGGIDVGMPGACVSGDNTHRDHRC